MSSQIITNEDVLAYKESGCLKKPDFLSFQEKETILSVFLFVLGKYVSIPENIINTRDMESDVLHHLLLDFRERKPLKFGEFYDELSLNAKLRSIFFSNKFISFYSKLLDIKEEGLFINGFMLRLDAPSDDRNSLAWHQDGPYYEQTSPINTEKNGTLEFVRNSHTKFRKTPRSSKGPGYSEQARISLSSSEKARAETFDASFGDMGAFHINLKHRSGENTSSKFRITLGCRFHDINGEFNIGKETYIYNSDVR
jgi:hypothetical protein